MHSHTHPTRETAMTERPTCPPRVEFHVSKAARDRYQFDESLFSIHGNVIIANFRAARQFAQQMNAQRDLVNFPEQAVRAGDINAMGLIDEILHALLQHYRTQVNSSAIAAALAWLQAEFGEDEVDKTLVRFASEFPALRVYKNEQSLYDYIEGSVEGYPNRLAVLEELVMLWLANNNPAYSKYLELFDDLALESSTVYPQVYASLRQYFDTQPPLEGVNLLEALEAPIKTSPDSLSGQLEFLLQRWSPVLGANFLFRVLGSLDFLREESKPVFGTGGGDGAQAVVYEFGEIAYEPEKFTLDKDWMPSLVLIAKNTYVWLDQLSREYERPITRLDQVPDAELERLGRMGFSGLWLIGLWERSAASQKIKQLCGNPEAVASAYSLYDYVIANDLGGPEAYESLKQRAWRFGLRMAADMVPNHVGIYSKWVIEHPDWFISLDYSPFPNYSFNGVDLSEDGRVGIFLEDHYYSKNDAAVVFKRIDRWTGSEQYIYHGNDGTSMPWNDTAQLNYLNPEVREAVIQTILHVARQFPIIRFDAAMTLAKKHFQRLWFPEPGSGGDIPTRAEFGLTREQFNAAMPEEFWREVVDRAAVEAPDTLLLAEAFWLMEGYFVRTLGMHRVYNSAFMNMLRDEKNAEYRLVIKNTIEFDREILKRYVNFMNNPDERTAVDQFGKGDKYLGVATMLATMPGLPMFGHGQIEGYTEKYGMEYRRAYWDERPDSYLVERHRREISPLLHKRYIFAEVNDFLLYDFYTREGYVNEDIFAYSNRGGDERGLVVYHNRFNDTRGWIKNSASYAVKIGEGDEKQLQWRSLAEGLGINPDPQWYTIFRDLRTGLEYLRNNGELASQGLYLELGAYDYHVFMDFRQVADDAQNRYGQLSAALQGGGVPNMQEALQELFLQAVHLPYMQLVNPGQFRWLLLHRQGLDDEAEGEPGTLRVELEQVLEEVAEKALVMFTAMQGFAGKPAAGADVATLSQGLRDEVEAMLKLQAEQPDPAEAPSAAQKRLLAHLHAKLAVDDTVHWSLLFAWAITHATGRLVAETAAEAAQQSRAWLDEWLLRKAFAHTLRELGASNGEAWRAVSLLNALVAHQDWATSTAGKRKRASLVLESLLADEEIRRYLGVNRYQDVLWFNQEAFEDLLWGLQAVAALQSPQEMPDDWKVIEKLRKALMRSEYQVDKLLAAL
jgi:hypothetical protein